MPKSLLVVVSYVRDAERVETDYVQRLAVRSLVSHEFTTDLSHSRCVVLGGAEHPPWLAVMSGKGPESLAEHILSEHPVGPRHLVFFTDEIETDIEWLRQRGYGYERVVSLDGVQVLRRVTATLPELAQIVDLIERPSGDADASVWLRPIVEAINTPVRTDSFTLRGSSAKRPKERPPAILPSLRLPSGEAAERWLERIREHDWSPTCRTVVGERVEPRFARLISHIASVGCTKWWQERTRARESLSKAGVGSADFTTSGGPFPLVDSPVFVDAVAARHMLECSAQRGRALRDLLADKYADRPTPVSEEVWRGNPFAYVQPECSPPQPSGLVQLATDFLYDAGRRAYVPVEDNTDSGRSGLATLEPVRGYFEERYPGLARSLDAWPIVAPGRALLDHVLEEFVSRPAPFVVMAFRREPPPYDQPDWEDVLLARQMGIPLLPESRLVVDGAGLSTTHEGRRKTIDVLLHRRPSTHYQFHDWMRLVRAGKLRIIDPINSALCNDRALRAYIDPLVEHYCAASPALPAPETLLMSAPDAFERVSAEPHRWVYKERGGAAGRRVVCGSDIDADAMPAFLRFVRDVKERWIAQREIDVASCLFVEAENDSVRVWEGRYSLHAYTTVGATLRPMLLLTARVSPSVTHRVPGAFGMMAADVWICER